MKMDYNFVINGLHVRVSTGDNCVLATSSYFTYMQADNEAKLQFVLSSVDVPVMFSEISIDGAKEGAERLCDYYNYIVSSVAKMHFDSSSIEDIEPANFEIGIMCGVVESWFMRWNIKMTNGNVTVFAFGAAISVDEKDLKIDADTKKRYIDMKKLDEFYDHVHNILCRIATVIWEKVGPMKRVKSAKELS